MRKYDGPTLPISYSGRP